MPVMSAWRRKAIELIPFKKAVVEQTASPMALWIELSMAAEQAFRARPADEPTLRAIFAYARYCWASADPDVTTAVVLAFFENIVRSEAVRADLHRWLSQAEFDGLREPFQYHLSPEAFTAFADEFKKRASKANRG
jgi:hypothetical protein